MKQKIVISVVLMTLASHHAVAQQAGGLSPQMQQALRNKMQERLRETDDNGDGAISHAEFMQQAERRFQTADLNGDGKITAEEFQTLQQKMLRQALEARNAQTQGK